MIRFDMYRIRVVAQEQLIMFADPDMKPQDILREALLTPGYDTRYGEQPWRIGDRTELGGDGVYLTLGRIKDTNVDKLEDDRTTEVSIETYPHTHVLIDIPNEVCGIARKSSLSPKTGPLAKRLVELLEMTAVATVQSATFEISGIADPSEFIQDLTNAEAIRSFTMMFSRPNTFNVNQDIIKPSEEACRAARGKEGRLTFLGKELNPNWCVDMARELAKAGQQAKARMKMPDRTATVTKTLRKGNATYDIEDEITSTQQKRTGLGGLLSRYEAVGQARESATDGVE